jgi:hypothetical protein
MNLNLPLFFNPGVVCRILDCNLRELRTLYDGKVLEGLKIPEGLRISSESVALYIGERELMKKRFLWEKEGK